MTDRQKKLVMDYGQDFVDCSQSILDEILHLACNGCSVLTDAEMERFTSALYPFTKSLREMQSIVQSRIEEVG